MAGLLGLYLYPINIESAPNFVIRKAFERNFSPFLEYDWVNLAKQKGLQGVQQEFLEILKRDRPAYTFVQLQNTDNMSVQTMLEMAKYTKIIHWTGDVREDKNWYKWFTDIGKSIFLTLFTN